MYQEGCWRYKVRSRKFHKYEMWTVEWFRRAGRAPKMNECTSQLLSVEDRPPRRVFITARATTHLYACLLVLLTFLPFFFSILFFFLFFVFTCELDMMQRYFRTIKLSSPTTARKKRKATSNNCEAETYTSFYMFKLCHMLISYWFTINCTA